MQNSNIKDFVKQPLVSDKDSENTYQGVLSLTQNQINEKIQVELGYGSDLYMNEEDETKLNELPEIEKEKILYERNSTRMILQERYELIKRQRLQAEQQVKLSQAPHKQKLAKNFQSSNHSSQCSDCSGHSSSGSNSSSSSSSSSSQNDAQKPKMQYRTLIERRNDEVRLSDVQKCQVTRTMISKVLEEAYFDDLVVGAFVKVVHGQKYKLCEVAKVTKGSSTYSMQVQKTKKGHINPRVENISTNQELLCVYGASSQNIKLSIVSNQKVTSQEYEAYKAVNRKAGRKLMTIYDCSEKVSQIGRFLQGDWNKEQIDQIVQRNVEAKINSGNLKSLNTPYEKCRLLTNVHIFKEKIRNCQKNNIQLRSQLENQLQRQKGLYDKIIEWEKQQESQLKEVTAVPAIVKEEMTDLQVEETPEKKEFRNTLRTYREQQARQDQIKQEIDKMPFFERTQFQAQMLVSSVQQVKLGIDDILKQDNFGGFFDEPVKSHVEREKPQPYWSSHQLDSHSMPLAKVQVITFDEYFQ